MRPFLNGVVAGVCNVDIAAPSAATAPGVIQFRGHQCGDGVTGATHSLDRVITLIRNIDIARPVHCQRLEVESVPSHQRGVCAARHPFLDSRYSGVGDVDIPAPSTATAQGTINPRRYQRCDIAGSLPLPDCAVVSVLRYLGVARAVQARANGTDSSSPPAGDGVAGELCF